MLAGVLVTASTLHGENDNVHGHLFVIGPILLVAGIVALARVMFKRAKGQQRRRRGCRRLREDHPPSPGAQAERNEVYRQPQVTCLGLIESRLVRHIQNCC